VEILLVVEWKGLLLVFQRSTREARGTRRLDVPMRVSCWDMARGDTIGGREDAGFTTDGTKTIRR